MTLPRARWWVLFVALVAFGNSLGNGFAYDDDAIIPENPVVTEAQWGEALLGPYWTDSDAGSGLYRPVTVTSFAVQWRLWGDSPLGYHLVNVALHALVCLLVLALLARFTNPTAALAGALFFAVQPVHVEAVANVVGQSEMMATAAVLLACLVYMDSWTWGSRKRALGLVALAILYLVGLGSKEIAVTLPGLLFLLELARRGSRLPVKERIIRAAPTLLSLSAVLGAYLVLRLSVLGTLGGEVPAPELRSLGDGARVLTAIAAWTQYLRLMVFPMTLAMDYAPGVMNVAHTVTPQVLLGLGVLLAWLGGAAALARRYPVIALGLAWFAVAILPVSNLLFPVGILLAERTLYLPSVGGAIALAGVVGAVTVDVPRRTLRLAFGVGVVAGGVLLVRTVTRNPVWESSYTLMNTQAREHPESYLAWRARASGLARVGQNEQAGLAYDYAVTLAPDNYSLLGEAGEFHARMRQNAVAEEMLRHAVEVDSVQPAAYRLLAEMLIRQGRGREGHRVALEGLARAGADRELWGLVSEAYIQKGDLEAAVRARRAALGQDPGSVHDWNRLAELLDGLGRSGEADEVRQHAATLSLAPPSHGRGRR